MSAFRKFKHFYQDARLREIEFPAHGEMRLMFDLDVQTGADRQMSGILHFRSIQNYDEVVAFFNQLPQRAEVMWLAERTERPNWVEIDFWRAGKIEIQTDHVVEI